MSTYASILLATLPLLGEPYTSSQTLLRTASTHPVRYYFVEPAPMPARDRPLPVLVCIAGADSDFKRLASRFAEARGDQPFLLVIPCGFSNTNAMRGDVRSRYTKLYGEDLVDTVGGKGLVPDVRSRLTWDEAGLMAILNDVNAGQRRRVYLTGFSGGGFLTWWMTLRHPESFAGVVPVCPNYAVWAVDRRDASSGKRATPIRVISGEKDPLRRTRIGVPLPPLGITLGVLLALAAGMGRLAWLRWQRLKRVVAVELGMALLAAGLWVATMTGLDFQTATAVALTRKLGHPVEWIEEIGMGHDPAPARVLETISEWEQRGGSD